MIEEELKDWWQSVDEGQEISINPTQLFTTMEKAINDFDEKIRQRDQREKWAVLAIVPIFTGIGTFSGNLLTRIGCGIIVVAGIFIVYWLWKARQGERQPQLDDPVKDYLLYAKSKVERQIRLLETILYWYLLPLYTGLFVFTIGFGSDWLSNVIYLVAVTGLYYWIYRLNHRVLRNQFLPLKENIERTLAHLEK